MAEILLFGPTPADSTAETVFTNITGTIAVLDAFTMAQPSTGVACVIRLALGTDGATTRVIEYPVAAGTGTYIVYPGLRITGTSVLQLSSVGSDDVVVCTGSGRRVVA